MKKVIQVISVLCLSVFMSVSSFACNVPSDFYKMKDGDIYIGKFATKKLSDEMKFLAENFIKCPIKYIIYHHNDKFDGYDLIYPCDNEGNFIVDCDDLKFNFKNISTSTGNWYILESLNKNVNICWLHFNVGIDNLLSMPGGDKVNNVKLLIKNQIDLTRSTDYGFFNGWTEKIENINNYDVLVKNEYKNLYIEDDGGLFSQSEPSEPEEPKPPVVIPPVIPSIPKGDGKFVCYDTSIWLGFLDYVLKAIGTSSNMGLRIFSYLIGIWIVTWVVRKFTK